MPSTPDDISALEAREALDTIEHSHRQVLAEIDVPGWYWWFLALGWVAVGVIVQFGGAVLTALIPLVFGAIHAVLAQRALSGRHRTGDLSVRRDVAGHSVLVTVFGFLVALCAATVAVALLLDADGARHPSLFASVVVALLVLAGGPRLMAALRRRRVA
jgi:hypothetical protein